MFSLQRCTAQSLNEHRKCTSCFATQGSPCAARQSIPVQQQRLGSSSRTRRSLHVQAYTPGHYDSAGPSNLGELQRVIEQDPSPEDPYGMQRVSPDSFSSRGYYTDGPAIFSSLVLLLVLLALTFQRILGLDRFITKALKDWKDGREYARRKDMLKAREGLEEQWKKDDT